MRLVPYAPCLVPADPLQRSTGPARNVPKQMLLFDETAVSRDAQVTRLSDINATGAAMIGIVQHLQDLARLIDDTILLSPFTQSPQEERADVAL